MIGFPLMRNHKVSEANTYRPFGWQLVALPKEEDI